MTDPAQVFARVYRGPKQQHENHNMLTNFEISSGRLHSVFGGDMLKVLGPIIVYRSMQHVDS